jgi:hypothetical protein
MSGHWYFHPERGKVRMLARFDAYRELHPGQTFHGVTFDALQEAGSGIVEASKTALWFWL